MKNIHKQEQYFCFMDKYQGSVAIVTGPARTWSAGGSAW